MQILNATFHYNVYGKYHGQVRLTEIFFYAKQICMEKYYD